MKKELIAELFQKFENACYKIFFHFAESRGNGRFEKQLSKKKGSYNISNGAI